MKIDLEKTIGYDVGLRSGADLCRKTLCKQSSTKEESLMRDMAQLVNEIGLSGTTVKQQLPVARLVGYLQELARAVDMEESLGVRFRTNLRTDWRRGLMATINYSEPEIKNL